MTPYAPAERYAAGDYPTLSTPGQGLPAWTRGNRSVADTDVVLWYTFGMHHMVRAEEWPVLAGIGLSAQPSPPGAPHRPAQVAGLQASVARDASGVCQLRLRNTGAIEIVAWVVTVQSREARYIAQFRHDGWRDRYHLPSTSLTLDKDRTHRFTVRENGTLGILEVRIHLVVGADDVAYGISDYTAHTGGAEVLLRRVQEVRARQADEALDLAGRIDALVDHQGLAKVLSSKAASGVLQSHGTWNWWRVTQALQSAESRSPADMEAKADISTALGLLREAGRTGRAPITLAKGEPMQPLGVGDCAGEP